MKATRESVELLTIGYEPIQVDGIPEGFSFKKPDITIGGKEHKGFYIAYLPLSNNETVVAMNIHDLLKHYNKTKLVWNKINK